MNQGQPTLSATQVITQGAVCVGGPNEEKEVGGKKSEVSLVAFHDQLFIVLIFHTSKTDES